ncbi:MAG: cytochrome b/b6 domain-containing protein [Xanthobacteraceae bacterium]
MQTIEIRVWDPFVRILHWSLAAAVLIDWMTDEPLWMHAWLGYLAAILVGLRIPWGFIGPDNARFVSFVRGPRVVLDYLAGLVRFSSRRYLGHSPTGGAMIVALLVMIAVTAGTGMANLAADQGEGPLAGVIAKVERPKIPGQRRPRLFIKTVHETAANITLGLVVLHVLGVALASIAHRENLVLAMITGRKRQE